jgi:hypothetical protein
MGDSLAIPRHVETIETIESRSFSLQEVSQEVGSKTPA